MEDRALFYPEMIEHDTKEGLIFYAVYCCEKGLCEVFCIMFWLLGHEVHLIDEKLNF